MKKTLLAATAALAVSAAFAGGWLGRMWNEGARADGSDTAAVATPAGPLVPNDAAALADQAVKESVVNARGYDASKASFEAALDLMPFGAYGPTRVPDGMRLYWINAETVEGDPGAATLFLGYVRETELGLVDLTIFQVRAPQTEPVNDVLDIGERTIAGEVWSYTRSDNGSAGDRIQLAHTDASGITTFVAASVPPGGDAAKAESDLALVIEGLTPNT